MPDHKDYFAKIYDDYVNKIYRFLFLKVGSEEIAQDLTSQVFTKGWKRVRTGQEIKNLPAYLYQIARAELADHYRAKSKFQLISTEAVQMADPRPNPEEVQKLRLESEKLRHCLTHLNDSYQNVLVWRYIDDYSIQEIAEIMEKSEGAVRVTIHRALKALKKEVDRLREENGPREDGLNKRETGDREVLES